MHLHKHCRNDDVLPSELRQKHQQWSSLDYALYEYFLARHHQEVSEQTSTFRDEVNTLIQVQDNFTMICLQMCGALENVNRSDRGLHREMMKTYPRASDSFA